MRRRAFLGLGASAWLLTLPGLVRGAPAAQPPRVVWINLRGALDSLHAIVPVSDSALFTHRRALVEPLQPGLRAIDDGFALHAALPTLHAWYREGCFAPVVAVATPYRERSHFAAQDVLESGLLPADPDLGWLARAAARSRGTALAIARSVPVVLRGGPDAQTWYPSALPEADDDLQQRLLALYDGDALLHARLQEGLATRAQAGMGAADDDGRGRFPDLAAHCGELLAANPALACAALEVGGWDTHNGQQGRLQRQFELLDRGLSRLRAALGKTWESTVVVVATEFGRTVAANGTGGTDHGTASAMLLCGGPVLGARVLGDWPGLAKERLWQQRDLMPTSDLRAWLAALLGAHWRLDGEALAQIFPGVTPRSGKLLRA